MTISTVRGVDPSNGKTMKWTKVKTLGIGSYGIVDLIKPINSVSEHQLLAIKYSLCTRSDSIQKERHILRRFHGCTNIVQCHGHMLSLVKGNLFYNLFLEYAPNGTLWDLIKKHEGNMPESYVKCYTKMLLEGIRCIHEKEYVHCDIKPENVLVFPTDLDQCDSDKVTLKIADFGLVRRHGEEFTWRTSTDEIKFPGTIYYMPPEENLSPKLDIWSIGCIVLQMVTGRRPWERHSMNNKDLAVKIRFLTSFPIPDEIPKTLSDEGKDFIMRCFTRDPCERWSADMLLSHPFLVSVDPTNNVSYINVIT